MKLGRMKWSLRNHVNVLPFAGCIGIVEKPTDRPPTGARGHNIVIAREAAEDALHTLIGMAVNYGRSKHDLQKKIGVIEQAALDGDEIVVGGFIYAKDHPSEVEELSTMKHGMSYEMDSALIGDIMAANWRVKRMTFTGAAILHEGKAAEPATWFTLL